MFHRHFVTDALKPVETWIPTNVELMGMRSLNNVSFQLLFNCCAFSSLNEKSNRTLRRRSRIFIKVMNYSQAKIEAVCTDLACEAGIVIRIIIKNFVFSSEKFF